MMHNSRQILALCSAEKGRARFNAKVNGMRALQGGSTQPDPDHGQMRLNLSLRSRSM